MSETRFTPGPYTARIDETATVRDADGDKLAQMSHLKGYMKGRRDADEVAATARLFAAAPELYEALKDALGTLESLETIEESNEAQWVDEQIRECKATLARARGETP